MASINLSPPSGIFYKDGTLTYKSESTGWFMALVDASAPKDSEDQFDDDSQLGDDGRKRKVASKTQWVIIDNEMNDRFIHEGDTILPGSGTSWTHVKSPPKGDDGLFADMEELLGMGRGRKPEKKPTEGQVSTEWDDGFVDFDELPWQVIAIMDPEMLGKLMRYKR